MYSLGVSSSSSVTWVSESDDVGAVFGSSVLLMVWDFGDECSDVTVEIVSVPMSTSKISPSSGSLWLSDMFRSLVMVFISEVGGRF